VRIARKVTHPNVCRILEFGTQQRSGSTDEPVPFLTMPLLTGETLARRIERDGRLPPSEALRVLRELAAGLGAVHEVGVVHLDFKSDNVFLVRGDDGNERAVVMDFGLARALEQGDRNKTTGRVLIGTPAYMAPEQVEGKKITRAVDVYAFGIVAFESLTGRVPFVAETAAAVALARLQRSVEPPSSLISGLDKRWDAFVLRCLRRAPEQRFADVTELRAALDALRGGAQRKSRRPAAAGALAAAVLGVTAWIVASRPRPSDEALAPDVTITSAALAPAATLTPALPLSISSAMKDVAQMAAKEVVPPAAPPRFKPERIAARPKRSATSPTAAALPAPPSVPPASPPAEAAQPDRTPFARRAPPRSRQADDLVNPF
jgi:serine/threonine-protein kinase